MNHHESHEHHHKDDSSAKLNQLQKTPWTEWLPLMVVVGFIVGLSLIFAARSEMTLMNMLYYLMGFFFILFSLFKLINLPGFAMGYHEYDLIAERWYGWGYIYPFIELALGTAYLLVINNPILHIVTIIFSGVVCVSVWIKLAKHETFQCACLGTVLKVPLTKVSLVEYAAMALMAIIMLVS